MALARTDAGAAARTRRRLLVRGAVQGVGFRPFVHGRATALGLAGWVANCAEGVTLEVEGDPARVAALIDAIRQAPPVNAVITAVDVDDVQPRGEAGFAIRPSELTGARVAQVLPDIATCPDCLRELLDPLDRRYLYPFVNCTHCGPRYSIVEGIPYDRARTSMRRFIMCEVCRAEYENPSDRRFHAEPNACPDCGPQLQAWDGDGNRLASDHEALLLAADAVRAGCIVAAKGIGGFHLVTDARDEAAVGRLRVLKGREEKPFAVMFPALADVAESCRVSALEEGLLTGPQRPIVLLRRTDGPVARAVAPGNPWLGAFLPYAPLHHLLMRELRFPIVATSGNASDEPIATDEREALTRLAGIADLFLVHDRPIVRAVDDSVVRVVAGRELVLRRARGYAPAPVPVPGLPENILALGGHLKCTVALTRAGAAVLSQHIGDLDTVPARAAHGRAAADIAALHAAAPRLVVRDLHPDYASSHAAAATGLPVAGVQHHLAHVAACMAENGIAPPVLGVAWDGTGYGPDGTIWGGEFLLIEEAGWRRVAHLRPFRLPGGEAAVREPRRSALGLLFEAFGPPALDLDALPRVGAFSRIERAVLRGMLEQGVNAPLSSSAGRLFDAFAALCGLRQRASYEGQAAAELEWAAAERTSGYSYGLAVRRAGDVLVVDWKPALEAALADLQAGQSAGAVSEAFHNGLAAAIVAVALQIGVPRVALTGGCFQNLRLTEATIAALRAGGLEPVWHRRVPPNDGGIALGQAVWAAWSEQRRAMSCA
jgi:hydrogenase maturation protein HypF